MKTIVTSAVVGFLFAIGLGISGMTNPNKVLGFLNVFGGWDPSLMFVMIGAIAVHFSAYRLIRGKSHPVFTQQWHIPKSGRIDKKLVLGSVIFGVGWGLAGYCPGPALTALASLSMPATIFAGGMAGGLILAAYFNSASST